MDYIFKNKACVWGLGLVVFHAMGVADVHAQSRRPTAAPDVRQLDTRAEKVEQDFLKSLADLASEYEKAGEADRTKEVLELILKLRPDTEAVKRKIKEIDEAIFDRRSTNVELDVSRGWVNAGVMVTKDLPVRVQAEGTYRMLINEELGPDGYPQRDVATDLVASLPTGSLIAMIAPATRQRNQPNPEPFLIGSSKEFKPRDSGILFLRVNTPPQAKCTGKLKVSLSGNLSK